MRADMAEKLGFEGYTALAYRNRQRRLHARARRKIPRAGPYGRHAGGLGMLEAQRRRLGVGKLRYYDESLVFPGGNADPAGSKDDMLKAASEMYSALPRRQKRFFDFMTEHELFDLEDAPGKHLGSYCTSLPAYKAPFIFSNFNGTSADVDVLTHRRGTRSSAISASG